MRNKYPGKHAMPLIAAIMTVLLSFGTLSTATANDKLCKTDIKATLSAYEKALNGSNVDNVLKLYAKEGIFMPANKPTSKGQAQVRAAYQRVFKELDLNISFNIKEIEWRKDIAFVRTVSDGKIKLLKQNVSIQNHTRELFIMKRIDNDWKIYRYMFNQPNAPKH